MKDGKIHRLLFKLGKRPFQKENLFAFSRDQRYLILMCVIERYLLATMPLLPFLYTIEFGPPLVFRQVTRRALSRAQNRVR